MGGTMILTIKNNYTGTRSYLGGIVTVADSSNITISRDLNVPIAQDSQFIADATQEKIILNNGASDLSGPSALELIKFLSTFITDPVASVFAYYSAPINIAQSAASTAGTTVWSMFNADDSNFLVIIEKIILKLGYIGTTGTNLLRYELARFNTAAPSAGTTTTPIKGSTLAPDSDVEIRYLDTGLTTTSVVFEDPFAILSGPDVAGTVSDYIRDKVSIKLAPGEGLAIRLHSVASVGQTLTGEVIWSIR